MDAYLEQLPQQMVHGLTLGGVFALIAVGFSMVYGVLFILNFAHGELYMIGGFAGWWTIDLMVRNHVPLVHAGILIILVLLIAMTVSACLGIMVERFAYRPLRKSPRMHLVLSALGISLCLQAVVLTFHGPDPRFVPSYVLSPESFRLFYLGDLVISSMRIIVIAAALLLIAVLTVFLKNTRLGKAIRAVAQDREAATLMGIDTDKIIVLVFLISSALGGAAGILAGLLSSQIDPYSGLQVGFKGLAAALLGGMGTFFGPLAGGLILGFLEAFSGPFLPGPYKDMAAFVVLFLVLLFRPWGLFGKRALEKI